MIKISEPLEIQGPHLNIVKEIYSKLIANNKLNGEKLEVIPLKSGTRQDCPFTCYLPEVLYRAVSQQKEIKGILIGKEKVKASLFVYMT